MERKIYSGVINLSELEIGDSILDGDTSQWNHVTVVPQIVADTWACLFRGSHISKKSKVGESPMKDWQNGLGIIVATEFDLTSGGEKLIMLRKAMDNGFGLFRSVNSRKLNEK